MKTNIIYLFLMVSLVPSPPASAKSHTRSPSTEPSPINVVIAYGDQTTDFLIEPTKSGATLSRSGHKERRHISSDDLAYVQSQVIAIHRQTNDQTLCARQYIEIVSSIGKTVGCIGSKSPAAREAIALANLLNAFI